MTEDEEFFAWLDGELDSAASARVEARVARDPQLAARAEQHRRLGSSMRAAFDPLLKEGAPSPHFQSHEVIDFGARVAERERRRSWLAMPQWASLAATLALGLVAGSMIGGRSETPVSVQNGQLVAAASLDRALDSQLASAGDAGAVRVGLTFRDRSGAICRSFEGTAGTGLACREGNRWQVEGLFAPAEASSSDYRTAAGQDPRLAALIDDSIVGDPFDAAQEKAAKDRGWR